MPYTARGLRDYLWVWGEHTGHGYWKGHLPLDPDCPPLAQHYDSRLPCATDYLDVSRAFVSLNPRLPDRVDDLGFYRATGQLNRAQSVLWLYYIGVDEHGAWGSRKFREDVKAMSPQARDNLLYLEEQRRKGGKVYEVADDARGDELIAARLGVSLRTVERDRHESIARMVAFLNPRRRVEQQEAA